MNYTPFTHAALLAAILSLAACAEEGGADRAPIGAETGEDVSVYGDEPIVPPLDVVADTPSMPNADYGTVKFAEASSALSLEARANLDQVADNLEEEKPVLLTLRLKDDDAIEATEPRPQFEMLAPERVTAVKRYLQEIGVAIEVVAVDQAGVVANFGEDNAMARAPGVPQDAVQHLVITITAE